MLTPFSFLFFFLNVSKVTCNFLPEELDLLVSNKAQCIVAGVFLTLINLVLEQKHVHGINALSFLTSP